jgi:hypothetical protein
MFDRFDYDHMSVRSLHGKYFCILWKYNPDIQHQHAAVTVPDMDTVLRLASIANLPIISV